MQMLASIVVALSLAAPDPRTIDPDSVQPEIVTDGGTPDVVPVIPTVPPPDNAPPAQPKPAPVVPTTPPPTDGGGAAPPVGPVVIPVETPDPPPEADPVDRSQKCFAARGRCRRLGIAGFSTLGAGVTFLAMGIGFTQVAPFPIPEEPAFQRSLVPAGRALVGVGIGALLAGALLVGSGFAVHRKFQSGEERVAKVRLDAGGLHW